MGLAREMGQNAFKISPGLMPFRDIFCSTIKNKNIPSGYDRFGVSLFGTGGDVSRCQILVPRVTGMWVLGEKSASYGCGLRLCDRMYLRCPRVLDEFLTCSQVRFPSMFRRFGWFHGLCFCRGDLQPLGQTS
jgi:hypothetical protein